MNKIEIGQKRKWNIDDKYECIFTIIEQEVFFSTVCWLVQYKNREGYLYAHDESTILEKSKIIN